MPPARLQRRTRDDAIGTNGFVQVFDRVLAEIDEPEAWHGSSGILLSFPRDAYAPGSCQVLQARSHIDAMAEQVAVADQHLAYMHPNAEHEPLALC